MHGQGVKQKHLTNVVNIMLNVINIMLKLETKGTRTTPLKTLRVC